MRSIARDVAATCRHLQLGGQTSKLGLYCSITIMRIMVLHQILFVMLLTATTTNALTVVITGTSQGIGLDAASRMIREGHTVVHACRSMERAELAVQEAGGGIPMECNLASLESIRSFAARLLSMYRPLHHSLSLSLERSNERT